MKRPGGAERNEWWNPLSQDSYLGVRVLGEGDGQEGLGSGVASSEGSSGYVQLVLFHRSALMPEVVIRFVIVLGLAAGGRPVPAGFETIRTKAPHVG